MIDMEWEEQGTVVTQADGKINAWRKLKFRHGMVAIVDGKETKMPDCDEYVWLFKLDTKTKKATFNCGSSTLITVDRERLYEKLDPAAYWAHFCGQLQRVRPRDVQATTPKL